METVLRISKSAYNKKREILEKESNKRILSDSESLILICDFEEYLKIKAVDYDSIIVQD